MRFVITASWISRSGHRGPYSTISTSILYVFIYVESSSRRYTHLDYVLYIFVQYFWEIFILFYVYQVLSDILTYFGEWTLGKRLFLFYVLHGLRRRGMEWNSSLFARAPRPYVFV